MRPEHVHDGVTSRQRQGRARRAVVTGGAGFLGSHLCSRLLAGADEVVCLDNLVTGSRSNVARPRARPPLHVLRRDVTTFIDVAGRRRRGPALRQPRQPVDYLELPIQTLKVGALGTHNALGLAKAKGARFLLASHRARSTATRWSTRSPRATGATSTRSARAAATTRPSASPRPSRWPTTATTASTRSIVRIFNTYGPRMRPDDGRVVPNLLAQALAGEPLTVYGDGSQTRSFCYVDDLVEGILRLLRLRPRGPVNIGNPPEVDHARARGAIRP